MPAAGHDQFARLFTVMNDAAVGRGEWDDVLVGIQRLLGVTIASIDIVDKKTRNVRLLVTEPISPDELKIYNDHIWWVNPRYSLAPISGVGEVIADRHIDPEIDAQGGEYYEWLSRAGGTRYFAGVKLYENDDFVALSSIHVPAAHGPVERSKELLYRRLVPHLANALSIHQALAERGGSVPVLHDGLAAPGRAYALLCRDGRILECSADFEATVAGSGVLVLNERRLHSVRASDRARLARLIGAAVEPDPCAPLPPVRFQPPLARHGLLLRAVRLDRARELFARLRPVAMLVLIDLDAPIAGIAEELRTAWGLTPREADLAILVGQGCRLDRAAAQLGIGEGTARQHLKGIFRKMEIDRQTQLAHLVTRLGS